jgi:hypothetical protein
VSFRPESALNPRALRRVVIQLAVVAAVTGAALLTGSRPLRVIAGVVDILALLLAAIAAIVAWRVGGRGTSLGLYVGAAAVFAVLAVANFA